MNKVAANVAVNLQSWKVVLSGSAGEADYFTFLGRVKENIALIPAADKNEYLELVKKELKENTKYQNIFKAVHNLQDNIFLQVENRKMSIFGGGAGHTDEQMKNMQMLFFCAAYDADLEFLFELDIRYSKTVEITKEVIRHKVLSNKKVLFPFYRMITDLCFEAERQNDYKRIKLVLEFLERISLATEHAPDKLHPVVSEYSYLAFAIMISFQTFIIAGIDDSKLKHNLPTLANFMAKAYKEFVMGNGSENMDKYDDIIGCLRGYYALNASS